MATLTISDTFKAAIQSQAESEGYSTPEAYLQALVEADVIAMSPPQSVIATTQEKVGALVREGLASPARAMSQNDLERWRSELIERHADKGK
jgi:hypothetical protein